MGDRPVIQAGLFAAMKNQRPGRRWSFIKKKDGSMKKKHISIHLDRRSGRTGGMGIVQMGQSKEVRPFDKCNINREP